MRVAMVQMLVEGGEREGNIARACDRIRDASALGADIAVLPECLDVGWTHPSARALATAIPGPVSAEIATVARERGIHVVAGLTERDGDHVYNTAVLINPDGELVLKHRKINILDIAHDLYTSGTAVAVVDTALGRIGINTCADNFPETLHIGRTMATMGAECILSPCAWAVPPGHDNDADPYGDLWRGAYSTLTREYPVTVIGVSNVGPITGGPWEGHNCVGCSLAMEPGGLEITQGPYGEETILLVDTTAAIASARLEQLGGSEPQLEDIPRRRSPLNGLQ